LRKVEKSGSSDAVGASRRFTASLVEDCVVWKTAIMELTRQDIETLIAAARQDGENIRALARIAEIRERRLTALEDGDES